MTHSNQPHLDDRATQRSSPECTPGSARTASEDALNRSRFLASMGHTLRGPLNSILGFTEMLLEGTGGPLTDRQRSFLEQIAGAGERQLEIIDNLITLARHHAEEAPYRPRPINIHQLLDRAVTRFRARAEEASITIELDVDPELGQVYVDSEGIERAVGNLLSNSLRHTEAGGMIRIAAGGRGPEGIAAEIPPDTIGICVADTGEGIDSSDHDRLFDDLDHSPDFEARRQQRLGTGLPLARRLLERDGGSISIQSSGIKGEGARFRILLPLFLGVPEAHEASTPLAATPPPTAEIVP